jgi:peptide chain release factor 2
VKELKGWIEPFRSPVGARERARENSMNCSRRNRIVPVAGELDSEIRSLGTDVRAFELRSLLRGPDDWRSAQIEIAAGAGGTEAMDWSEMLMRMYTRWAERHGYKIEILDMSEGEEAGIKGAVLEISGQYAYGFLRPETGVHRPRTYFAVRFQRAPPHLVRAGLRVSRCRHGDQHRDSR